MNFDEFCKNVKPGRYVSPITPFVSDLIKLKNAGYTLHQIQDFLSKNGVTASISNLGKVVKKLGQAAEVQKSSKDHIVTAPPKNDRPEVTEAEDIPLIGSHRPSDLDKIFRAKVDMAALARYAKEMKKKGTL